MVAAETRFLCLVWGLQGYVFVPDSAALELGCKPGVAHRHYDVLSTRGRMISVNDIDSSLEEGPCQST